LRYQKRISTFHSFNNQLITDFTTLLPMKTPRTPYRILLLFVLLSVVASCNKTTDPVKPANQYLVSSTLITTETKEQIGSRLGFISPLVSLLTRYNVKVYKIVYKTKHPDGTELQASGAIIVPDSPNPVAMISQQHGTILNDSEAPSNYDKANSEAGTVGALFASIGYIMVCPDYIGYGTSKNVAHTYEHRQGLATASLDMIRAAREFLTDNNVNWDKRLYITGYSEGGFATMSLQKKIEEEFPTEFNLRASSCGAGAYHKTGTMRALVSQRGTTVASNNRLYSWVLLTYNSLYKLNRPTSAYFIEPFATQAQGGFQNVNITTSFDQALTSSFKAGITGGTDSAFLNAVKDNDVHDWAPKTPTRLYHGDADDLVPFFNSQDALDAMKRKGATKVELVRLSGKTHSTGIQDFLLGTYDFFAQTP
jgi:pimeloyl-ACP methyl ester carboxylesterase